MRPWTSVPLDLLNTAEIDLVAPSNAKPSYTTLPIWSPTQTSLSLVVVASKFWALLGDNTQINKRNRNHALLDCLKSIQEPVLRSCFSLDTKCDTENFTCFMSHWTAKVSWRLRLRAKASWFVRSHESFSVLLFQSFQTLLDSFRENKLWEESSSCPKHIEVYLLTEMKI